MNEVDVKELVDVGQRTALLLGEITGRLIMHLNSPHDVVEEAKDEMQQLLEMMQKRISSIYYGVEDE
jgi:hypothetical protein